MNINETWVIERRQNGTWLVCRFDGVKRNIKLADQVWDAKLDDGRAVRIALYCKQYTRYRDQVREVIVAMKVDNVPLGQSATYKRVTVDLRDGNVRR